MNEFEIDDKVPKVVERSDYTWILRDYAKICKAYKNGCHTFSPIFPESHRKCHWRLMYYPNGEENKEGNVAIFLTLAKLCANVHAEYLLTVRNSRDELIIKKETGRRLYDEKNFLWGYNTLCTCEHLASLVGQDDILKINVVVLVEVFTLCYYHIWRIEEESNGEPTRPRKFGALLESGEFSDFTLKLPNSVEIPVHRNILAASSPVFKVMFEQKLGEGNLGFAEIKDADKDSLMFLLKFIYTDHIDDLPVDTTIKLLQLADKYQISDLKEHCSKVLMRRITVLNALDVLRIADLNHADELKRAASDFVSVMRLKTRR